ncbi:MAG: alpha/beta fold hydrolase, partial [Gemmatimonadetes bacterium]|nr:alpha/beta fold hydrolase [Gemmatimonadota bacterium]NIR79893.1 alpha/beta fold hydrolase [Gemmatimonadota bacterium]NIT88612.1 alpha/beta fold hydrolase [Gemmatimonadota bacterium]NIU32427.1 alpha/beta fold hydrolase [Gemmatimonadota bacterium]NIV62792.1 alpha/beta fold hydrolase [Gemmatimonadota bacterium]
TRHYHAAGYWDDPRVDLVGHSMGGLVISGYLEAHGGDRVRKVATLATPFQGSFEAVIKVAVGTANLGTQSSASRERETARVTPAIYHLAPSMDGGVVAGDGLSDDLYDPAAWQPGVVQTIMEYIRLYGL